MEKKDRQEEHMRRKATKLLVLTMGTILTLSLAACGDGSDGDGTNVVTPVAAEPIPSDLDLEILNLETKYNKGEFQQTDYLALADAYSRAGYIRKQRDLLEQDYRLYEDADAFATLQTLSVNLEEEAEDIRSQAQAMQTALEQTEDPADGIALIDNTDWFTTMMPKLKEGKRDYYLEQDGELLLYLQTGYGESGGCFSRAWYTGKGMKRYLSQEGTTIQLVTVTDYGDGAFDSWRMDCATGSITHEQGTLQNGVLTGDYTCSVYTGESGQEASTLWKGRQSVAYITYTGSFTSDGKILTEQPSAEIKKKLLEGTGYADLILYAYDADGENCLWKELGADQTAEDFRFDAGTVGLKTCPEYTSYEVTENPTEGGTDEDTNTAENPQIRIYDGEIQWFDGKYWVSTGSVKEMTKQDPFTVYEEQHDAAQTGGGSITGSILGTGNPAANGNNGQNITDGDAAATAGDKNSGSIQKETPAPTAKPTAKPSNNKPSSPAVTPAPTAAPTPVPIQNDDDDDHDDGGGDSGSSGGSDAGSSGGNDAGNSGGNDSGSSGDGDSGSSGGNDVDMDWTPDLL